MSNALRLLALIVLGLGLLWQPTHADYHGSRIKRNQRERQKLFERARELKRKKNLMGEVLHGLDENVSKKKSEIGKIKTQLSQAEQKQRKLDKESKQAEADLANYQELMGKRARQIYMQGDLTYVDLLLQATNVSDFVDRVFFVQAIMEQDKTLIESTEANQVRLQQLMAAVQQQIVSVKEIKANLDKEMLSLQTAVSEKREDLDAIEEDFELVMRQAKELEAENKRLEAQIRNTYRSGSGYSGKWGGSFKKPCKGPITSGFGYRNHPIFKTRRKHNGVDIGAPEGTPVYSGDTGKVIITGWMSGYGNTVVVDHGSGCSTLYGHLSRIKCNVGDKVTTSSVIGLVGSTGYSTGNHLHFEVRINGTPVDPLGSLR